MRFRVAALVSAVIVMWAAGVLFMHDKAAGQRFAIWLVEHVIAFCLGYFGSAWVRRAR